MTITYNPESWRDNAKFKEGDLVNYINSTRKYHGSHSPLLTNKVYTIESLHPGTPNGIFYQVIGGKGLWYIEEDFAEAITEIRKKKLQKIFKNS